MKILFITNIPVPYRMDFFNELGKYCDLTVLVESEMIPRLNKEWLKRFEVTNFRYVVLPHLYAGNEMRINYGFKKYLKDGSYDLVVMGCYSDLTDLRSISYLNLYHIPFVLNSDGGLIKNDDGLKRKIKSYFIGSAKAWICTGKNTSEYLMHYGAKKERIFQYPFTSLRDVDILSNPITVEERQCIKKRLELKGEKIVISVGQLIYRKGFDVLLNAWAEVKKQYHLIIIGGGDKKQEYQNIIRRKGLANVHIMDFMDKKQLFEYYKASDLFVLPTREDIWGLVINEAMACGLPIITTDRCVAGLELVENNESGFVLPTGNENQLVEKTNLILSNDVLRSEMSKKSLQKIRPYTIENMAKKHTQIFNQVIYGGQDGV